MDAFVAVTDNRWFRFLRERQPLKEVNFWVPGAPASFRALGEGEPLLFKLHAPHNVIAGGGWFLRYSRLPIEMAWEAFGEKNGAPSLGDMKTLVDRYRRSGPEERAYIIGCRILVEPFFFDDDEWIAAPPSFRKNIVSGKRYDTTTGEGALLWSQVLERLGPIEERRARERGAAGPTLTPDDRPRYGEPVPVRHRLGQGSFRVMVTEAYERRCAVTDERALPVLEAAHIFPVGEGGPHRVANGLLLRSDVHRLFDRGYVTVTPDLRFRVSSRLRSEFENGEPYYPYDGETIHVPPAEVDQPGRDFLEWHADTVFRS